MKKGKKGTVRNVLLAAAALVFGMALTSCGSDGGSSGGPELVPETVVYRFTAGSDELELSITTLVENRAARGDKTFELKRNGTQVSKGSAKTEGGELKFTPEHGQPFTTTIINGDLFNTSPIVIETEGGSETLTVPPMLAGEPDDPIVEIHGTIGNVTLNGQPVDYTALEIYGVKGMAEYLGWVGLGSDHNFTLSKRIRKGKTVYISVDFDKDGASGTVLVAQKTVTGDSVTFDLGDINIEAVRLSGTYNVAMASGGLALDTDEHGNDRTQVFAYTDFEDGFGFGGGAVNGGGTRDWSVWVPKVLQNKTLSFRVQYSGDHSGIASDESDDRGYDYIAAKQPVGTADIGNIALGTSNFVTVSGTVDFTVKGNKPEVIQVAAFTTGGYCGETMEVGGSYKKVLPANQTFSLSISYKWSSTSATERWKEHTLTQTITTGSGNSTFNLDAINVTE